MHRILVEKLNVEQTEANEKAAVKLLRSESVIKDLEKKV